LRLVDSEFEVKYGKGKTIFVEHMNDLLANGVPDEWIADIIRHCMEWPENTYVFQSKNPMRFIDFLWPDNAILGTTIETNRVIPGMSDAPVPAERYRAMRAVRLLPDKHRVFITIEPVLDFDVYILAGWIAEIRPDFLNLGADSKGNGLPEPMVEKILTLTEVLRRSGIELREKHNLERLVRRQQS